MPRTGGPALPSTLQGGGRGQPLGSGLHLPGSDELQGRWARATRGRLGTRPPAGPGFGPRPPGLVGRARGKDALGSRSEPRAFRGGGRRPSRVVPLVPSCASGRSLSRRLPGGPQAFPATHSPFPAGLGRNPREKGLGAPT